MADLLDMSTLSHLEVNDMTITTRTKLQTILRQYNQGFIDQSEAYHAICNLLANKGE